MTPNQSLVAGVAALWVFSAGVAALDQPDAGSSPFYRWLYKFLKALSGDLGATFAKYMPPTTTEINQKEKP